VTDLVEGRTLGFLYRDKMMRVGVHFAMEPSGAGTRLTHSIEITPQTFLAKLFSPLIRKQLPKQTITAMESLRTLLGQQ
jgi:carbon monoxide dehydrogenase subunit G